MVDFAICYRAATSLSIALSGKRRRIACDRDPDLTGKTDPGCL